MKDSKILEIEIVLDKINLLFRSIREHGAMDPVERDLLKKYSTELQALLQNPSLSDIRQQQEEKVLVEKVKEKETDPVPEKKEIPVEHIVVVPEIKNIEKQEEKIIPEVKKEEVKPDPVVEKPGGKKPLVTHDDSDAEDDFNTGLNTRLHKDKKTLADKIQNKKASDLRSIIDLNAKLFLTNELFAKDKQAYESAISELNALPDLSSAEHFLQNQLAARHNWGAKQTEAKERLLELLHQKFN
ncbi:MAG: hypothetical protein R2794_11555 [Chitinophagales bacterium]